MSTYGMYTSGLGAMGQSLKIDQISNNLANVATPGYRRGFCCVCGSPIPSNGSSRPSPAF